MNIFEPTPEQIKAWDEFVETRPPAVREVAKRFKPWKLYKMQDTGHRVMLYSLSEPENKADPITMTVIVSGKYNAVAFERRVFGINPDTLVECDLPGPDEPVGAVMTQEEAHANLDEIKLKLRPDIWVRDSQGRVVHRDLGKPN